MNGDSPAALARAEVCHRAGGHPLALLDLDLTLIENAPRTRAILAEWADTLATSLGSDLAREVAARVQAMPLRFSIRDNLWHALGLRGLAPGEAASPEHERFIGAARAGLGLWRDRFFDPAWLVHDVALPGAVEAVARLVAADVTVVYVTARKVEQAAATVASLHRLGFPIAAARALLLTNDGARSDHESKVLALDYCARLGTPVLAADNEPAHANAMHRRFPEALTVLVGSRHSEPAPPPDAAVLRVATLADAL